MTIRYVNLLFTHLVLHIVWSRHHHEVWIDSALCSAVQWQWKQPSSW